MQHQLHQQIRQPEGEEEVSFKIKKKETKLLKCCPESYVGSKALINQELIYQSVPPKHHFYCLFNLVSACLSKYKLVAGEQCIFILIPTWLLVIDACIEIAGHILNYVSEEKKLSGFFKSVKLFDLGF